jgi:hypothetical protein
MTSPVALLNPLQVLVVGQTPPPLHGQAIMIERLVEARLAGVKLVHVRMNFSHVLSEVGRFRAHKLAHLAASCTTRPLDPRALRCIATWRS